MHHTSYIPWLKPQLTRETDSQPGVHSHGPPSWGEGSPADRWQSSWSIGESGMLQTWEHSFPPIEKLWEDDHPCESPPHWCHQARDGTYNHRWLGREVLRNENLQTATAAAVLSDVVCLSVQALRTITSRLLRPKMLTGAPKPCFRSPA